MKAHRYIAILGIAIGLYITAACSPGAEGGVEQATGELADGMRSMMDAEMSGTPMESGAHEHTAADHMTGLHAIPEEAAEIPNPIAFSDASVAEGKNVFTVNCAVCHGENGRGDGPTAAALAMQPADLHEAHVQGLSDGALFYIITTGREGTPMPAWEAILSEEQRWNVVNYLRTFHD